MELINPQGVEGVHSAFVRHGFDCSVGLVKELVERVSFYGDSLSPGPYDIDDVVYNALVGSLGLFSSVAVLQSQHLLDW